MGAPVPHAVRTFVWWAWALLTAAAVAWLVYTFALRLLVVVVPIAVALLITAVLKLAVDWGERHGVNRTLSTVVVVLGVVGAAVAVRWVVVPRVADQLMELRTALSEALRAIRDWLRRGPLDLAASQVDQLRQGALRTLRGGPADLASLGLRGARVAFTLIAGLALTPFFTFFFVRDGDRFSTWLAEHAPAPWRSELRAAGSAGWRTLTDYSAGWFSRPAHGVATAAVLLAVGVPLVISSASCPSSEHCSPARSSPWSPWPPTGRRTRWSWSWRPWSSNSSRATSSGQW